MVYWIMHSTCQQSSTKVKFIHTHTHIKEKMFYNCWLTFAKTPSFHMWWESLQYPPTKRYIDMCWYIRLIFLRMGTINELPNLKCKIEYWAAYMVCK